MISSRLKLIKCFLVFVLTGTVTVAAAFVEDAAGSNLWLVSVQGESRTLGEFRSFVMTRPVLHYKMQSHQGVDELLSEWVDSMVFRLEGLRIGVAPDDLGDEVDGYYFRVMAQEIRVCPEVTPDEAARYFSEDPMQFATPAYVRVARVVLFKDEVFDGFEAEQYARQRLNRIRLGQENFDDFVTFLTKQDRLRPEVGDLGFAPIRVDLEPQSELERQLLTKDVPSVLGPIVHEGLVIGVHLRARHEPIVPAWEDARQEVMRFLHRQCRMQALEEKRQELYQRYDVRFNREVVEALRPAGG